MKGHERKIQLFIQETILNKTGNGNSARGQDQVWVFRFNHFPHAGGGIREGWLRRWLGPQVVTSLARACLKKQASMQVKSYPHSEAV